MLEGALIQLLRLAVLPFPVRTASWLGEGLGWTLLNVFRLARRQTLTNLELAFGARFSPAERLRVAALCYRHFGAVVTEFLSLPRLRGRPMEDYMVLENPELLAVALRRGHGAIVITGHLGNWELLSAAIVAQGHAYSAYVGRQHNPIADAFVNSVRSRTGQHTIHKQAALRGMVRVIRKGEVLGLLPDQHHSRNRFFVRFFGRPVSVAPGPAQLVSHTDAALLFAETWRVGRFRYRARFRPLEAPRTSGDEEYDVLALSQLFMEALEEAIGRHPEQYFWMHRRWRPPPGEAQLSPVNRAFLAGRPPPPGGGTPPPAEEEEQAPGKFPRNGVA